MSSSTLLCKYKLPLRRPACIFSSICNSQASFQFGLDIRVGRVKNWPQGPCLIGKKLVIHVGNWYYQLWYVPDVL